MMGCTGNGGRRELQINAYLDDELDLTSAVELESHLEQCPDCARLLAARRALRQAVAAADLRYTPAPDQARRLRAALGSGPAAVRTVRTIRTLQTLRTLRAIAALLLVAMVSWTLGRRWPASPGGAAGDGSTAISEGSAGSAGSAASAAGSTFAEEVLAEHLRAQLAGHPEDVASSDRHTVKPWFAGHLDYSPPVVDLAAQGYPLRGGRLDYVGGRPVAALVYQAGNHLVSVFVWPADGAGAPRDAAGRPAGMPPAGAAAAGTRRGFHELRWTQADMDWWAISDVAADHLADLVRALRAQLPPAGPG